MWLCNLPQGDPTSDTQLEEEQEHLDAASQRQTQQEFLAFKEAQVTGPAITANLQLLILAKAAAFSTPQNVQIETRKNSRTLPVTIIFALSNIQETDTQRKLQKQDYEDRTRRMARRKLKRFMFESRCVYELCGKFAILLVVLLALCGLARLTVVCISPHRWEDEGIESLLYDDGVDYGDRVPTRGRSNLGVTDLLDALDYKYDALRHKLFLEMLRLGHG